MTNEKMQPKFRFSVLRPGGKGWYRCNKRRERHVLSLIAAMVPHRRNVFWPPFVVDLRLQQERLPAAHWQMNRCWLTVIGRSDNFVGSLLIR
jgi:hypothetical protein